MAEPQAQILARIWDDPEWCALPMRAQWLYQSGLSQRDVGASGLMPLRETRWTSLCEDADLGVITSAVKRLVDTRFWVVDEEYGEVFYRSYMRTREVWRFPNTLKTACSSALAARSPLVRAALVVELERLPQDRIRGLRPTGKGQRQPWAVYVETISTLRGDPNGPSYDAPPTDHPDVGQLELPTAPVVGYGVPNERASAVPNERASNGTRWLGTALGTALGSIRSTCSGSLEDPELPTSVVEGPPARTPAPAREAPRAPDSEAVDPILLRAQREADHDRQRADRSLLTKQPTHAKAYGFVRTQTEDWEVQPFGRELEKWRVEVSALMREGVPDEVIATGMQACAAKGYGASLLHSFVIGEANRRPEETRVKRAVRATATNLREDGGRGFDWAGVLPSAPPREEIGR